MIKTIKELTFNEDNVATLLFDNGFMLTIDSVPAVEDVKEGFITRVTNVNGECLQTKYWSIDDAFVTYVNFVEGLSVGDKAFK